MLRLHGSVVRFDVENNDVEEEAEENDEVKMMMLRRRTHPTTGSTLCASLRTRRAHGHFTRATLRENLQEAGPRMEHWSTLIKHRPVLILLDTLSANTVWGTRHRRGSPQYTGFNFISGQTQSGTNCF